MHITNLIMSCIFCYYLYYLMYIVNIVFLGNFNEERMEIFLRENSVSSAILIHLENNYSKSEMLYVRNT